MKERESPKWHPMTDGVKWTEYCADTLEKLWNRIPSLLGHIIATVIIFAFGATLKGEWILIMVHFLKQMGRSVYVGESEGIADTNENLTLPLSWEDLSLERLYLKDWPSFWLYSAIGSYTMYFLLGGFIHWYFYVRRRHKAHEWKIQPDKFLPPHLELDEIFWGSLTLLICSAITGTIACYAANNGPWLKIYYDWNEYGWWWFFLQIPAIFIYQDYATYWLHRIYHFPFLYKRFHKLHHKYKQPTAFSVTAIHPVEIVHIQITTLLMPIFLVPLHWAPFYGVALYAYYHAILDHSGVAFKAFWWQPWQPDAAFHDNHHQYFHVNFGFNIKYWDKIHKTERRKDRVYREDTFYGTGKSLDEVPEDVLRSEIEERKSENPLAYKDNRNKYELTENDLQIRNRKVN
uniref:Fatty acid hydroxylase domain-containing protein n=2 Tax=Lutzomyia longipalpis TaxID=7200 RepID=A0A1B0CE06_LUTLO